MDIINELFNELDNLKQIKIYTYPGEDTAEIENKRGFFLDRGFMGNIELLEY